MSSMIKMNPSNTTNTHNINYISIRRLAGESISGDKYKNSEKKEGVDELSNILNFSSQSGVLANISVAIPGCNVDLKSAPIPSCGG